MELRNYQLEAVEAVVASTERSVAISLPTGTGKTRVARALYDHYRNLDHKVVFVVPSIELMEQAGKAMPFQNFLGDGVEPDFTKSLLISTIQSLSRRIEDLEKFRYSILIIDEAHRAVSPSYADLIKLPWEKIISLSATMFRADGKRLADVVDKVVYEKDIHWAIKEKYLTPYKLLRPAQAHMLPLVTERVQSTKEDGSVRITERKDYNHNMRNGLVKGIITEIQHETKRKAAIMFCNTVAHAKEMATVMGSSWGWCSGERREDLERFKKGELFGIVSVQLLLEGFDYPPADFLIVNGNIRADSTGKIRWIQLLGRILRLHSEKQVAIALDLSVNGCPDIEYSSNLEGINKEEEEAELLETTELTVLERLEHPCLLDLETLLEGLRQVNSEKRKLQKELRTNHSLIRTADGYVVAGSNWRISAGVDGWTATDGKDQLAGSSVESLLSCIEDKTKGNLTGPSTAKQQKLMVDWGMSEEIAKSMSCQDAHDYISHHMAQRHVEPATAKQIRFLKWKYRGDVPDGLSKQQAKMMIARLNGR